MLFFLSLINILIFNVISYPYSLPGDISWPRSSDFLAFKQSILGRASIRGDADYNPHTWNRITNVPKPAVIVQPKNNQDIINALKFARQFNIRVSVQSTGHHQDHRNIYDNSVHIDMSTMNSKSIDLNRKTLTVGPGNNFSHIEKYVAEQSNRTLVALCGAEPGVGVCKANLIQKKNYEHFKTSKIFKINRWLDNWWWSWYTHSVVWFRC